MWLKSSSSLFMPANISGSHMSVQLGHLGDAGIYCVTNLKDCLDLCQCPIDFWMTATSHQDHTMDVLLELGIPVVEIITKIWYISKHASLVGPIANIVVDAQLNWQ